MPSMPKGETVGNVVIDGKGGSRGRDRQRKTAEAKEKTAGNVYREHEKKRGRVYLQRKEAEPEEVEHTEIEKQSSSGGRGRAVNKQGNGTKRLAVKT